MHISLTVGAVLIAILVVAALALWYVFKPSPTTQAGQQPTTGAVSQATALDAIQKELDAAVSKIDTSSIENALLQK